MEQKRSSPAVLNPVCVFRQVSAVLGIAGSTPLASERPLSRRVPLPSAGGEQEYSAAWWASASRATRGCWGGALGHFFPPRLSLRLPCQLRLKPDRPAPSLSFLRCPWASVGQSCWYKQQPNGGPGTTGPASTPEFVV